MEVWKDIKGYEGLYQVSSFGRIKGLNKKIIYKNGSVHFYKEKIKKLTLNKRNGYLWVKLSKKSKTTSKKVHKIVAESFLNHIPNGHKKVIDHIDNNKLNNSLKNLQIITQRENSSKDKKNKSSKFTGVYWNKKSNKWHSQIQIKSKKKHLGYFDKEYDAHLAYQKALKNLL